MTVSDRTERATKTRQIYHGKAGREVHVPDVFEVREKVFPGFSEHTWNHLFGDVMSRPGLSMREHSIIILTTLTAVRFEPGLKGHMRWSLNVGISREEILEIITSVSPHCGWPNRVEIFNIFNEVYPGFMKSEKDIASFSEETQKGLSSEEKIIIIMAASAARRFSGRLKDQIELALKSGISRGKIMEVIFQVTPFSGWPVGVEAIRTAAEVFGAKTGSVKSEQTDMKDKERQEKGKEVIKQMQGDMVKDEIFPLLEQEFPDFLRVLTEEHLFGEVWSRPGLSLRDRCMITLSVLTAFRFEDELKAHIRYALNVGISKEEINEIILHTANYTCWGSGVEATRMAKNIFLPD